MKLSTLSVPFHAQVRYCCSSPWYARYVPGFWYTSHALSSTTDAIPARGGRGQKGWRNLFETFWQFFYGNIYSLLLKDGFNFEMLAVT